MELNQLLIKNIKFIQTFHLILQTPQNLCSQKTEKKKPNAVTGGRNRTKDAPGVPGNLQGAVIRCYFIKMGRVFYPRFCLAIKRKARQETGPRSRPLKVHFGGKESEGWRFRIADLHMSRRCWCHL